MLKVYYIGLLVMIVLSIIINVAEAKNGKCFFIKLNTF